jgi:phage FluMu protein gp41
VRAAAALAHVAHARHRVEASGGETLLVLEVNLEQVALDDVVETRLAQEPVPERTRAEIVRAGDANETLAILRRQRRLREALGQFAREVERAVPPTRRRLA